MSVAASSANPLIWLPPCHGGVEVSLVGNGAEICLAPSSLKGHLCCTVLQTLCFPRVSIGFSPDGKMTPHGWVGCDSFVGAALWWPIFLADVSAALFCSQRPFASLKIGPFGLEQTSI